MNERNVHSCDLDGRLVQVFERVSEGFDPTTMIPMRSVVEVFYACEAPDWPKVRVRARRTVARLLYGLGRRPGLSLDDTRFDAAFRVDAEDEDFALRLLSPEMRRLLLEKRTVDWSMGHGLVKLFYRGRLRRDRIARSLDRLRRFWALVPPELS